MRVHVALLCLLVGCTGARGGDGSGDERDAGVEADAGLADAAAADASEEPADAGPMCEEELVEVRDDRPCRASTRTCVEACSEPTCVDECLAADTNPGCRDCINRAIIGCFNRNGCQADWNCYRACVKAECATAADLGACIETLCIEPEDDYYACTEARFEDTSCPARHLDCLPEE